jgi:hypothetical protein
MPHKNEPGEPTRLLSLTLLSIFVGTGHRIYKVDTITIDTKHLNFHTRKFTNCIAQLALYHLKGDRNQDQSLTEVVYRELLEVKEYWEELRP